MRGNSAATQAGVRIPNASGGISRLAYARAAAAGIDPDVLLEQAGITRPQIRNPRATIKVRDQIAFLNLVSAAMRDEFLGFHLAQACDLREIGLLYYVLASSDTLIDALQRAARYTSIVNEGISLKCIDGKWVGISCEYVGVSRHADRHQIEFLMTAIVRICRQLTGRHLLPERVRLIHRRKNGKELKELLGTQIEFGSDVDDIVFPSSIRRLSVVSADPYLNKLLMGFFEEAISHRKKRGGSFQSRVERIVAPLLPHGKAQVNEVARQLGVSQRTFARRLTTEGLTFSVVVERLRYDLADSYLAEGDFTISEIAWLLGYRNVGSFSHAFKRWADKTPSEARRRPRTGRGH